MSEASSRRPRPTVGHHFGALLQCPQRAWMDYWGDPKKKLKPPGFLFRHQREGLLHEAELSRTLYPDAVTIPSEGTAQERRAKTLAEIRRGAEVILQAYLLEGDALGIADVLERSSAPEEAPTYRIGEFKRATSIKTEHVLQVRWYAELLSRLGVGVAPDAFFVLGDGQRRSVTLGDIEPAYASCTARLRVLQSADNEPGPHFARGCHTCPWRGECVPRLRAMEHVSLLPGVTREAAQRLAAQGVGSWREVAKMSDELLDRVGFDALEIAQLRRSIESLEANRPVTRARLKASLLTGLTPVAMEFAEEVRDEQPRESITAVHYLATDGVERITVAGRVPDTWRAELARLTQRGPLAVYGASEAGAVAHLCRAANMAQPAVVDVCELIEAWVHVPLLGLELADVAAHLELPTPGSSEERLGSVRSILEWLRPVALRGAA